MPDQAGFRLLGDIDQVLQEAPQIALHPEALLPAQILHLLDQVGQVESFGQVRPRLRQPAQGGGLFPGPGIEVAVVQAAIHGGGLLRHRS
jgi:hypothetical protein